MENDRQYKKPVILLAFFLLIGFLYRYYLASLAHPIIVFDGSAYSDIAIDILNGKVGAECCAKNAGYGVFLAIIYALFGIKNLAAIRLVQIVIDLISSILVYVVARQFFPSRVALWSFILYIVNPFTSAFTGLPLAETVSFFYIMVLAYLLSLSSFSKHTLLWLFTGGVIGLLIFTRHSFYYLGFALLLVLALRVFPRNMRIKFLIVACCGFLLASSYSLTANYIKYNKMSIVPPYGFIPEILYTDFFLWRYPEVEFYWVHPVYQAVVQEFWDTPLQYKTLHNKYYMRLFLQLLKTDWPIFLKNMGWHVVWLWDKDHLYTYYDPFYPADRWVIRIANIFLLLFFAVGITAYCIKNTSNALQKPIVLFTLLMFFYILFLFPLLSNESRHTLAFYPLAIVWAGYGIFIIWSYLKSRDLQHTLKKVK